MDEPIFSDKGWLSFERPFAATLRPQKTYKITINPLAENPLAELKKLGFLRADLKTGFQQTVRSI